MMSVFHPKNPRETQQRLMRAAKAAMDQGREGKPPIWADPRRFKRLLEGVPGVVAADAPKEGQDEAPTGLTGDSGGVGEGKDAGQGERQGP